MLRQLARLLRVLPVVVAILLLAWLPISFLAESRIWFHNSSADHHGLAFVRNGYLCVMLGFPEAPQFPLLEPNPATQPSLQEQAPTRSPSSESDTRLGFDIERIDFRNMRPLYELLPSLKHGTTGLDATLPLWLLAVACLAWPTISLFVSGAGRRGVSR